MVLKAWIWDLRAKFYDLLFNVAPLRSVKREERNMFLDLVSDLSFNSAMMLDVGCGTGDFIPFSIEKGLVFGADISAEMIARARDKLPHVDFIRADVCHLPFKDESMDFISMVGLLEYFEDPGKPLSEASRIAKDDARIVVSFSRQSILNLPRKLWGISFFVCPEEEITGLLKNSHLKSIKWAEGKIQTQILCRKKL
ncbi:demethylmenaquinone methyltransferase [archaeon BMS3Abin16]|nr:demethylmenaquinone methyltransferase [archaeon BMS3Abin16]HDY74593.1 class I SAM-dependent methyltransferase [Euryarchaeota archaeon]